MNATTAPAAPAGHNLRRGLWSINISMVGFVAGDTVVKLLGRSFPATELLFVRSVIIVAVLATIMFVSGRLPRLTALRSPPMLARCSFDAVNILASAIAVIHMQLAEFYAILLTSPLLMTMLAVIFFREPVGVRRWLAIAGGFFGVVLVVKPDPAALDEWALVALAAALAAAFREILTSKIDRRTPSIDVTFYSALFTGAGTWLLGVREPWPALAQPQYLMLLLYAATWLTGAFLLVQACRLAPLSLVAAFRYTLLIWGAVAGYVVFGDVPDLWSLAGAAIIAACGLYTLHREMVRRHAIVADAVGLS
ncbi:MAG TPA: DMT family transporter [Pseudolabrys sp.]|nr:DMT family transporter [Pseudolabrys sp.]